MNAPDESCSPLSQTGPLPAVGTHLVEASAGTGKTHALATLAVRYVAELDIAIDRLLVVTFTRAAAAELRDRIRHRLVAGVAGLGQPAGGGGWVAMAAGDPVLARLADVPAAERSRRAQRLDRAVAELDAATITTIHGFCQQALASVGTTPLHDRDAQLVGDPDAVLDEVITDVIARAALHLDAELIPTDARLRQCVRAALATPDVRLWPTQCDEAATDAEHEAVRLTGAAIDELARRLGDRSLIAYDELVVRMRRLVGERPEVSAQLRARYPVALVDEFQDTDAAQWDVFERIYRDGGTLVCVGDPKQAIYRFRGGDVATYVAVASSDRLCGRWSLDTNWRSDGALVEGLDHLMTGADFGGGRIPHRRVGPAPHLADRRLLGAGGRPVAPIEVRCVVDPDLDRLRSKIRTPSALGAVIADLAVQVRRLLDDGPRPSAPTDAVLLGPADVAVLVTANADAGLVLSALRDAGVPAVVTRGLQVTDADAVDHWRRLLLAMERPSDPGRARAALATWFFGWDGHRIDGASVVELADAQGEIAEAADRLRRHGVVAVLRALRAAHRLDERLLTRPDGPRHLTDALHLAELLHERCGGRGAEPTIVAHHLRWLVDHADPDDDTIVRRVETDEAAVQIMTVHAAKGLEFGAVFLPTLWKASPAASPARFVDPDSGERIVDLGKDRKARRPTGWNQEDGDEQRRLAYVALTRARHRVVTWWVTANAQQRNGLAPLLFGPDATSPPADADVIDDLRARTSDVAHLVEVVAVPPGPPPPLPPPPATAGETRPAELAAARIGRVLDRSRGRWSFTSLAAAHTARQPRHDPHDDTLGDTGADDETEPSVTDAPAVPAPPTASAEPPEPGTTTTGEPETTASEPATATTTEPAPLEGIGAGPAVGTFVHAVLETVDFAATDVHGALDEACESHAALAPVGLDRARLVTGLAAALDTPLGDDLGGARLAEVTRADRLDELGFDLALADGASVTGGSNAATIGDLGRLVADHLGVDDVVGRWARQLAAGGSPRPLAGVLTGSIDIVVRRRHPDGVTRFHVVDHKTNRLGGERPSLADYHPDRLVEAMVAHHYPLQALLYTVALHRYLRWRLPAHDPARDLGACGYLFVRGMVGPAAALADGRTHGVWSWRAPPALVVELDNLLSGTDP